MKTLRLNLLFTALILLILNGCEGEQGEQGEGLNSLINIVNEGLGENCSNGGIKIETGIDVNSNGFLDADEVQGTAYVCNGSDGLTSLTNISSENEGDNCENGGMKIESGLDLNANGLLDPNEVTNTSYVCNGSDANNNLTKIASELSSDNCENGGLRIESGIDSNNNGILDDDEILATAYVCNDTDGVSTLTKITTEEPGDYCADGGVKIESGKDINDNGMLETDEIMSTDYACYEQCSFELYSSVLTATGTNNPEETILLNELDISIVWERSGKGIYTGTLAEPVDEKTTLIFQIQDQDVISISELIDFKTIKIENYQKTNTYNHIDGFDNAVLEIKRFK